MSTSAEATACSVVSAGRKPSSAAEAKALAPMKRRRLIRFTTHPPLKSVSRLAATENDVEHGHFASQIQ